MATPRPALWSALLKVACLAVVIVAANLLVAEARHLLDIEIRPRNEDLAHRLIMAAAVAYVLLLAVPFVPGVELGIAIIVLLGAPIVPLVYLCTLAGLALAFVVGRLIPLPALAAFLADLRLRRASQLVCSVAPLDDRQRLAHLTSTAPGRPAALLLRHRYLALALAINLPGNFVIGGGGGIALVAGLSRLYSVAGFLLTIALAVAPVPIAVMVFGTGFLTR